MSTDLALEHVNKVGKVAGGLPLVGITRSESTRDKCCLTYNKRNRLVGETSAMFGLTIDDAEYAPSANKDVGISKLYKINEITVSVVMRFLGYKMVSEVGSSLVHWDTAPPLTTSDPCLLGKFYI